MIKICKIGHKGLNPLPLMPLCHWRLKASELHSGIGVYRVASDIPDDLILGTDRHTSTEKTRHVGQHLSESAQSVDPQAGACLATQMVVDGYGSHPFALLICFRDTETLMKILFGR